MSEYIKTHFQIHAVLGKCYLIYSNIIAFPKGACATVQGVSYPGILFGEGEGVQQIQLRIEDTQNGDLGGVAPLVRGSEGSCNLVQEISFRIVKFSKFLVL